MKKVSVPQEDIRESDLGLVAALVCFKQNPVSIVPSLGDTCRLEFVFHRTSEVERLIKAFWDGKLVVEPQVFMLHTKLLKNRIFNMLPRSGA